MSNSEGVILLIEIDRQIPRVLVTSPEAYGFQVHSAADGRTGLKLATRHPPDLVILDLGLPDVEGAEIIKTLREWWSSTPVIILSGPDPESAKVAALELGADDYTTKPFGLPELPARVRAAMRRAARHIDPNRSAAFFSHGVTVNTPQCEVTRNGKPVALTPNELRVLATLNKCTGLRVTTNKLVAKIRGPNCPPHKGNYLRSYMATLRENLEDKPAQPELLLAEAGVGYRIAVEDSQSLPSAGGPVTPHYRAEREAVPTKYLRFVGRNNSPDMQPTSQY